MANTPGCEPDPTHAVPVAEHREVVRLTDATETVGRKMRLGLSIGLIEDLTRPHFWICLSQVRSVSLVIASQKIVLSRQPWNVALWPDSDLR